MVLSNQKRNTPKGPRKKAKVELIEFYRANEKPYGQFSNLYRRSVEIDGILYATAEHAYQAGKAVRPAVREWILAAPSPALAAMAAHGLYTWEVVPNWAEIKFDRMRKVLKAKFTQHADLQALLLSTGKARIVEVGKVNNAVNRLWARLMGVAKICWAECSWSCEIIWLRNHKFARNRSGHRNRL